ncbi:MULTISPECIES: preprotein translocase subunit SecE [Hydrogenovibrio]|jgi:preprotein translocase subunit SecE|uniref:Protein translocase subunit SecE n=1 Tax=Hydrogenovibrio marinus TaxID=28885 RepID=A0A067A0B7_HYDMR|nr:MULTISPECIES: preprotein translocase subunit SecE [Hydrogenovibrio]MBD3822086.1 preprotein translocase subunit SecE [Thiotrichales bacterium]KDN95785.1 preprotein translocase subunit SecE [Hydrogenovibrio marinus]MBN2606708.1 preprotein translocase subunit SecE [Thiotrichales bacterium]MPQ77633.1 preprotein translocase subunit SecE [Hydrogenovibrio sp. JE_KL2]BBN58730.1 protein translocase subunit SecE [Hydrogenovibrio marinus]
MSQKLEKGTGGNTAETVKNVTALVVLIASVVGYYVYSDAHAVVRVLGMLAGVALSGFIFYQSEKGQAAFKYLSNAKKEVRQVVWPTRQETVQMTLIVFAVVIVMSIFLWLVDMFFLWAVQLLTGQGG